MSDASLLDEEFGGSLPQKAFGVGDATADTVRSLHELFDFEPSTSTRRRRPPPAVESGTKYVIDGRRAQKAPRCACWRKLVSLVRGWLEFDWREYLALRLLDARQRAEMRLERWWKKRDELTNCICLLLLLLGVCICVGIILADDGAYVITSLEADYVRAGEPGVNFSLPSTPFTCAELQSGLLLNTSSSLSGLQARAVRALGRYPDHACVCGPMFGIRRQYMALRNPNTSESSSGSLLHLYNVHLDYGWDGDGGDYKIQKVLIKQSQRMLFPAQTSSVRVYRDTIIRVQYITQECVKQQIIVYKPISYCLQACDDLLRGMSVYDKARTRTKQ